MGQFSWRSVAAAVVAAVLWPAGGAVAREKPAAGKSAQDKPAAGEAGRKVVLDTTGFWRVHFTYRPPVMRTEGRLEKRPTLTGETPLPPAGWTGVDFDDRDWPRLPGLMFPAGGYKRPEALRNAGYTQDERTTASLALICMRGRFAVANPSAAGDLRLSVSFRGGLVAYLNGKEVARAHIPDASAGLEALAEDYPLEAYVRPDGKILGGLYIDRNVNDPESGRRWRLRVRQCRVTIPARALRKGVNVLALEVHRSAYRPEMLSKTRRVQFYLVPSVVWATCGLLSVRLDGSGGAAAANVSRPAGFQLWNSQPINPDFDLDYGDPNEPLRPVRIVGTRGGCFSGKVVAGSDGPIRGLRATMTNLASRAGGRIAASAVKVRYGLANGWEPVAPGRFTLAADLFDGLAEAAPAVVAVSKKAPASPWYVLPGQLPSSPGAVVPVWVTVAVPPEARPGEYRGALTVRAEGVAEAQVPVELKVCGWRVPPPGEFRTVVDIIQSPESVALQYGVPLWGEAHFKLLARSFERLGYVGNWTVYLPLIARCNLGNEQTLVRWIAAAPAGGATGERRWRFDYTPLERYLDVAAKHMGRPRIVCLYVWDLFIGGHRTSHQNEKIGGVKLADAEVPVTRLDGPGGEASTLMLPRYGEGSAAAWKALAAGVMERLRKRGLADRAMLGLGSDGRPSKRIVAFLTEVFPGVPWMRHAHAEWKKLGTTGAAIGYQATVYRHKLPGKLVAGHYSLSGWSRPDLLSLFFRTYERNCPLLLTRLLGELTVAGDQRGFARLGLDFWPVLKGPRGKPAVLHGRYLHSNWRQLDAMVKAFVPPGPEGAMASAHLEAMREGLQEAEARIFIERALRGKSLRAALGEPLVRRCRQVLDERCRFFVPNLEHQATAGFATRNYGVVLDAWDNYAYNGLRATLFYTWYQHTGWQRRSEKLFTAAAEVAEAIEVRH